MFEALAKFGHELEVFISPEKQYQQAERNFFTAFQPELERIMASGQPSPIFHQEDPIGNGLCEFLQHIHGVPQNNSEIEVYACNAFIDKDAFQHDETRHKIKVYMGTSPWIESVQSAGHSQTLHVTLEGPYTEIPSKALRKKAEILNEFTSMLAGQNDIKSQK